MMSQNIVRSCLSQLHFIISQCRLNSQFLRVVSKTLGTGSLVSNGMFKAIGSNSKGWISSMFCAIMTSAELGAVKSSIGKSAEASVADVVGVMASDPRRSYVGYVGAGTELHCDWASWDKVKCGGEGVISPVLSTSLHATENCGWFCCIRCVDASWASACSGRNISHQCSSCHVSSLLPRSNLYSLSLLFNVSKNLDVPILEAVGFARPENLQLGPILAHLLHGGSCVSHLLCEPDTRRTRAFLEMSLFAALMLARYSMPPHLQLREYDLPNHQPWI